MKKHVSKLKVRWRSSKTLFWFASIIISGAVMALIFAFKISKIAPKSWLIVSITTSIIVSGLMFLIFYLIIYSRAKRQIYHVDLGRRTVSIRNKAIRYQKVYIRNETIFQKMFELITLEFVNGQEKIVMKDVSKDILNYL